MEIVAIAAAVIAVTFIVLAGFLIPALIEIRKTAAAVRTYITDVESQLHPVLKELRELAANLRVLTDGVVSKTEEVKTFMTALGDTGRHMNRISGVLGDVAGLLCRSTLWMTGFKAAGHYVIDRIAKKRR